MPDHQQAPAWFLEWAGRHCAAFGFREAQAETVWTWAPVFSRLFRPEELWEATDYMIGLPEPLQWANEHRGAIVARIRHQRLKASGPSASDSLHRTPGVCCIECSQRPGAPYLPGMIRVPHPGHDGQNGEMRVKLAMPLDDPDGERGLGRWTWVSCVLCDHGKRAKDSSEQPGRQRVMTITEYERRYPRWRDVAEERSKALRDIAAGGRVLSPAEREQMTADIVNQAARSAAAEAARKTQGYK